MSRMRTRSSVVKMDDFPNEVLVMIFRQLPFRERIPMSAVSHRWNEVVFNFFADRIVLLLDERCDDGSVPSGGNLCRSRQYRTVKLRADEFEDLRTIFGARLDDLFDQVEVLIMEVEWLDQGILEDFVGKFTKLHTLRLHHEHFNDEVVRMRVKCRQMNPSVRNMVMNHENSYYVQNMDWVNPLYRFAKQLVSLDVTLQHYRFYKLATIKFPCLKTFRVVLECTGRFVHLTEMKLFVKAMPKLEELTIIYDWNPLNVALDNIWRLRNLHKVNFMIDAFQFPTKPIVPMPQVDHVTIYADFDQSILNNLKTLFPAITYLKITTIMPSHLVDQLITLWPLLEELDLKQEGQNTGPFARLQRLKKLSLQLCYTHTVDLASLDPVLAIPSLQELRLLVGTNRSSTSGSLSSGVNRECRVFVNGTWVNG